jgi:hypothetical protein
MIFQGFAKVPTVPGVVEQVADELPDGHVSQEWFNCSGPVEAGWYFDGSTFTPTAP